MTPAVHSKDLGPTVDVLPQTFELALWGALLANGWNLTGRFWKGQCRSHLRGTSLSWKGKSRGPGNVLVAFSACDSALLQPPSARTGLFNRNALLFLFRS